MPLPQHSSGTRRINGWEVHYNDWDDGVGPHRTPVDDDKQLPPDRKGCLDKDVLQKLGLTKHRMVVKDSIFFCKLLLPICDVNNFGIFYDPKKNYFTDIETFSARYAFDIRLLDSYGHTFKVPKINELVKFDGVVIHEGMTGGSDGAFYCGW